MNMQMKWLIPKMPIAELAMARAEYIIFQLALRYKIPTYTPEDIAQELRFYLWRKLPQYNPQRASLETWVNLILRRQIYKLDIANRAQKRIIQHHLCELKDNLI
jgi:DNA-directed RNA polymerase specialized sigma24 family protein